MQRLIFAAAASTALAGTAHATTDAGAMPATASGVVATVNIGQLATSRVERLTLLGAFQASNSRPGFPRVGTDPAFSDTPIALPTDDDGPLAGVPEPEAWVLLVAGFGLVGLLARRRRGVLAA